MSEVQRKGRIGEKDVKKSLTRILQYGIMAQNGIEGDGDGSGRTECGRDREGVIAMRKLSIRHRGGRSYEIGPAGQAGTIIVTASGKRGALKTGKSAYRKQYGLEVRADGQRVARGTREHTSKYARTGGQGGRR